MLRAKGDVIAVPKSEKASGVRGAGVRLSSGVVVRVGGGIVVLAVYNFPVIRKESNVQIGRRIEVRGPARIDD